MNKTEYIKKIADVLEKRKINKRENFVTKAFVNPSDDLDGELTLVGAQITVVLSEQAGIKYDFYKLDEEYLKNGKRQELVNQIKKQYPGIIFFACKSDDDNESRTIDVENNLIVIDNPSFNAAVELCGDANSYIRTMLQ